MPFCWKCGNSVKDESQYCDKCGVDVNKNPPKPPETQKNTGPRIGNQNRNTRLKFAVSILSFLLIIALVASSVGYFIFNQRITDLNSNNASLTDALNKANGTITSLHLDLDNANASIAQLNDDLDVANTSVTNLTADLKNANASINKLNIDLNSANASIVSLNSQNSSLSAQNSQLTGNVATLNSTITVMNTNYQSIVAAINQRFALTTTIAQSFVTPVDPQVSSLVKSLVTTFSSSNVLKTWQDMYALYNWVYQHIWYSYDSPEPVLPSNLSLGGNITWRADYWRFPYETIRDSSGDCEDQALLLLSMIRCYENSFYGSFVVEVSFNDNSAHMAVILPTVGGGLSILDPAGSFYTHATTGVLSSKAVSTALSEWSNHWATGGEYGLQVYDVFNESTYKTFSNNADFTNWIISGG
jgi:peptidoglycan hydrolase CwlO-like protein